MIYTWYKIFNLLEFNALDLVSKEYELELEDLGVKTILVTKGNLVSLLYEGVLLSINLNDVNPFEFDGHAVYIAGNSDVYLGIAVPDED